MRSLLILRCIVVIVFCISLSLFQVDTSLAVGNQSNQGRVYAATLIAPDPNFKINVYAQPDTRQRRLGYGLRGTAVQILEQVGSNEGYTWDRVQFENEPYLEGWVRGDFVAIASEITPETVSSGVPTSQLQNFGSNNPYQQDQHQGNEYQGNYYQDRSESRQSRQEYRGYRYQGNQQQHYNQQQYR